MHRAWSCMYSWLNKETQTNIYRIKILYRLSERLDTQWPFLLRRYVDKTARPFLLDPALTTHDTSQRAGL